MVEFVMISGIGGAVEQDFFGVGAIDDAIAEIGRIEGSRIGDAVG